MVLADCIWTVKALSEVVHLLKKLEHATIADTLVYRILYFTILSQSKLGYLLGCLHTLKIDFNLGESYLLLTEM